MEIQSLSICVPSKGCANKCPFCVSRQHEGKYRVPEVEVYERNLKTRMQFARDNHCNTVVITGTGEPVLNWAFFRVFSKLNKQLSSPFQWVELQTSGVLLNKGAKFLNRDMGLLLRTLYETGIVTISLSVANVFNSESNAKLMGTPERFRFNIHDLCKEIKATGFNLRLSLNMSSVYNRVPAGAFFRAAQELKADQITFRKLYALKNTEQAKWITEHSYKTEKFLQLQQYIVSHGRELEALPFGAVRYSVQGISTVIDTDCMSVKPKPAIRYLIVRENGKLYTKWDDEGSLLF